MPKRVGKSLSTAITLRQQMTEIYAKFSDERQQWDIKATLTRDIEEHGQYRVSLQVDLGGLRRSRSLFTKLGCTLT